MFRTRWLAGLLGIVLAAATAACSSSGPTSADSPGSGAHYSVGLVLFSAADPSSNLLMVTTEHVAKQEGWTTSLIDGEGQPSKAITAIQTLVQKKVNIIISTVFPPSEITAGAQAALAAGVPIATFGGGTGPGVQTSIEADTTTGQVTADKLIADTGGKGNLLELDYSLGAPCVTRAKMLHQAIARTHSTYNITHEEVSIPGQVANGQQFATAWLANHPAKPGVDNIIWGCFDDPAVGAAAAVKNARRTDVRIYGCSGTPQALQAIKAGSMTATSYISLAAVAQILAHRIPQMIKAGANAAPLTIAAPATLVDQANITQFLQTHPGAAQ